MTPSRLASGNCATYLLAGAALLLACGSSQGQQFVLFDETFTYTKEDADNSKPSKSHYYVRGKALNADRPKDWTRPTDYRNGTVHVRIEVLEKPEGGAPTTWSLCYIPNKGQKGGYGCTGTPVYKEKGVYERDVKMTEFWQNDGIVWEEGIKEMHLVMKDDSGGDGHAHKRKDPEKYFPTKVRITMIQVAKGAVYDPKLLPKAPADDRAKKDLEALAGTWEYVSQTDDGKEADKEALKGIRLTVTAEGKWTLKKDDAVILEGTGKFDPAKEPKAADWTVTSEGDLKGKVALGIYDVDKDTWKHCFSFDKRPEAFGSKEGGKITNAVLKRVKK